jgi:hypothetical protein
MSWADTIKATALAALAERTSSPARSVVDVPWSWNPYDVWLTRASQPAAACPPERGSGPGTAARAAGWSGPQPAAD